MQKRNVEILIVGAGPAGLAAALKLKKLRVNKVLVVDRDSEAGGAPRLCAHTGYGLRDLHRLFTGPSYAQYYSRQAEKAGIEVLTETAITGWKDATNLELTNPLGLQQVSANAVLIATGCRERPRSARMVPGSRPQGIFTTGSLQDFVHGYKQPVGKRVVVVGAELVSFSALLTCAKYHAKAVLMVTEQPRHQLFRQYLPFKWYTADILMRVPLITSAKVTKILGQRRVEAVEITHPDNGQKEVVDCDTVVFSGDWIPEHELARLGGITIDAGTKGPMVDSILRTSKKGVFAAGNVLRGAETADVAALEGRFVANNIWRYLQNDEWCQHCLPIVTKPPIAWISPNAVECGVYELPRGYFLFRVSKFCRNSKIQVLQGSQVLYEKKFKRLGPNLSAKLQSNWLQAVNPHGEITIVMV